VREHVRAALIAFALLVHGIAASPLPKSVRRAQFDTPIAQEEIGRWVHLLTSVGIVTTHAEIAEASITYGTALADLRTTLLGPFRPWFRISGTGQAWGLFTFPDTFPHQLTVEIERGGTWERIFAGLDDDATWMRTTLAYRRVRGVYDGNTRKPAKSYDNLANWLAARALADFPDATAARIGFVRFHTKAPGEPPDTEQTVKFQRVVPR
jgi:hypothetical protein